MSLVEIATHTLLGLLKDGIQRHEIPAIIIVIAMLYILNRRDKYGP